MPTVLHPAFKKTVEIELRRTLEERLRQHPADLWEERRARAGGRGAGSTWASPSDEAARLARPAEVHPAVRRDRGSTPPHTRSSPETPWSGRIWSPPAPSASTAAAGTRSRRSWSTTLAAGRRASTAGTGSPGWPPRPAREPLVPKTRGHGLAFAEATQSERRNGIQNDRQNFRRAGYRIRKISTAR